MRPVTWRCDTATATLRQPTTYPWIVPSGAGGTHPWPLPPQLHCPTPPVSVPVSEQVTAGLFFLPAPFLLGLFLFSILSSLPASPPLCSFFLLHRLVLASSRCSSWPLSPVSATLPCGLPSAPPLTAPPSTPSDATRLRPRYVRRALDELNSSAMVHHH